MAKLFRFDFESLAHFPPAEYVLDTGLLTPGLLRRKWLIFDLEATGLDYRNDEITEIALQELDPLTGSVGESWQTYVKIQGEIPPAISRLTSITKATTETGISCREALAHLAERYAEHIWIAQCGFEYDFPFLERVHGETGLPGRDIDALDPKIIFALLHPERSETFSTNFLCEYYAIDRSHFARHTAAGDVALITEYMLAMLTEARRSGMHDVTVTAPLTIKKFIPQPLE